MSDEVHDDPENQEAEEREDGHGSPDAGLPDADEVPEEDKQQLEEDRSERLDSENRPDGAEVDNTGRTFDSGAGMFTDSEGYDDLDQDDLPYAGEDSGEGSSSETSRDEDPADQADDESQVTDGPDGADDQRERGKHEATESDEPTES